jgi:hypothetical protein
MDVLISFISSLTAYTGTPTVAKGLRFKINVCWFYLDVGATHGLVRKVLFRHGGKTGFLLETISCLKELFLPFLSLEPICLKHMLHLYFIFKKYREQNKEVKSSTSFCLRAYF